MVFSILPSCLPVIYNSIPVKMLPWKSILTNPNPTQ
jgi:TRAP-type mannitol/chloroaromatic compound transport system permease small subunit